MSSLEQRGIGIKVSSGVFVFSFSESFHSTSPVVIANELCSSPAFYSSYSHIYICLFFFFDLLLFTLFFFVLIFLSPIPLRFHRNIRGTECHSFSSLCHCLRTDELFILISLFPISTYFKKILQKKATKQNKTKYHNSNKSIYLYKINRPIT